MIIKDNNNKTYDITLSIGVVRKLKQLPDNPIDIIDAVTSVSDDAEMLLDTITDPYFINDAVAGIISIKYPEIDKDTVMDNFSGQSATDLIIAFQKAIVDFFLSVGKAHIAAEIRKTAEILEKAIKRVATEIDKFNVTDEMISEAMTYGQQSGNTQES